MKQFPVRGLCARCSAANDIDGIDHPHRVFSPILRAVFNERISAELRSPRRRRGPDQQLSKAAIEASEDLSLHARMIEGALSMLDHMARRRPHSDEDDLVLQMLAARLFNSGASA